MTVANNTPYVQYSATAAQTVFNYTFEIVQQEDLLVYQRGENDAPDDAADLLVLNVDYTVAGVGNENGGTITLAVAATLNDVVTLKQNLTVERDTSFTNGGVLRAQDLNDEFDNQTLIQQVTRFNEDSRMLYYPDSAILTPFVDNILPVLGANQIWAKNAADTAIIAYDVPSGGGLAPSNATYLVQTADAELPNAQAMGALASGLVVNTTTTGVQLTRTLTGTANQIDIANGNGISGNPTASISANPVLTGTAGMGIPVGTTAQRIVPTPPSIGLRFNTDLDQPEYYDALIADWVQLQSSGDIANLIAQLAAHTVGDGASMIGLEDQGTVSNKTVQDLAEASFVTVNDDTATLLNSQQLSALALLLAGGTMAGTIDMDSNVITGLPLPTADTEAASKAYVDGLVFNIIAACNYSTTANLAGYVYDNGTVGVGATLTAGSNGAFSTDGASPALNNRIFVPFQTAQAENGIYTLTQVGDGSTPAILTRATDWDEASEMDAGDTVAVVAGTLYAGSNWMMTQTAAIIVGTTAITWIDISVPNNLVTIDGTQTITGDKDFTGLTEVPTPATATEAANKGYVDTRSSSKAQQETATDTDVYATPATQQYHPSASKAWVALNGTGTIAIRQSYNVSSLTDNGTGTYSINFTTAFSAASYAVNGMTAPPSTTNQIALVTIATVAVGSVGVNALVKDSGTNVNVLTDLNYVCVACFGDQ